jgi:hypothetical protein
MEVVEQATVAGAAAVAAPGGPIVNSAAVQTPDADAASAAAAERVAAAKKEEQRQVSIAKEQELREGLERLRRKMRAQSYNGSAGQDPRKLFQHYDRDNSGQIDREEFRNILTKAGILSKTRQTAAESMGTVQSSKDLQISDEDLELVFKQVDTNSDGSIGACCGCLTNSSSRKAELRSRRFICIDLAASVNADRLVAS